MPDPEPNPEPTKQIYTEVSNNEIYEVLTTSVLPDIAELKANQVILRVESAESHHILKSSGLLNSQGEVLLKGIVNDYRSAYNLNEARAVVAADKASRAAERARHFKWLGRPKALLWAVVLGIASGIGYTLIVH